MWQKIKIVPQLIIFLLKAFWAGVSDVIFESFIIALALGMLLDIKVIENYVLLVSGVLIVWAIDYRIEKFHEKRDESGEEEV